MRRVLWFVTLGVVAVALTGCNQSWPSCFCNGGGKVYYEECDPCTSYYGSEVIGGEYLNSPIIETLPGPATSGANAG